MTAITTKSTLKATNKVAKGGIKSPLGKNKMKSWNDMNHLFLKRFPDDSPSLTPGAKKDRMKHPHIVVAELDPTGRAKCKLCGDKIPKSDVRMVLFLECHKGYRNACTLHASCFWKHPERTKIDSAKEIHFSKALSKDVISKISKQFDDEKQEHPSEGKTEIKVEEGETKEEEETKEEGAVTGEK
eukprot:scaffold975_cov90-Cylindrotheca_fusiformis.AAC.6